MGEKPVLGVVVVLYNRALSSIPATAVATSLGGDAFVRWVVVDNSDHPAADASVVAERSHVAYVAMGGNRGISAAFNQGVEHLGDGVDYVLFLDQDTGGIDDYVRAIRARIGSWSGDILMPLVTSDALILSPCRRLGPWYRPMRRTGRRPRQYSCINSGMVVRRSIFDRIAFDEALFLDYVDHRFILDATAAGATLEPALDLRLEQDYSRMSDTAAQAHVRVGIFSRDVRRFYDGNAFGRVWAALLIGSRRLQAARRYRDRTFLCLPPGERG